MKIQSKPTMLIMRLLAGFLILASATNVSATLKTWTGAGVDFNWGTAANWGGIAPVNGDDLLFTGSTRLNNSNSFVGLAIRSLSYSGAGFNHIGQGLMITNGIMGAAFGLLPLERVTGFARKWFIVMSLYCLYRTGSYFIGEPYAMQLTGVVTALLVLYGLALTLPLKTQIYRQIVLLGRYSLLGYILQLGIIQVTVRVFGPFETPIAVVILAVVTLAATWAVTFLIHWLRPKARFVDLTYKAAFA